MVGTSNLLGTSADPGCTGLANTLLSQTQTAACICSLCWHCSLAPPPISVFSTFDSCHSDNKGKGQEKNKIEL